MERGEIAPEEQFLLLSTIFWYLILDFYIKIRIRYSLRDKRLFEIVEVEITWVDCILLLLQKLNVPLRRDVLIQFLKKLDANGDGELSYRYAY